MKIKNDFMVLKFVDTVYVTNGTRIKGMRPKVHLNSLSQTFQYDLSISQLKEIVSKIT